ncbi:Uncharacterised protein [BD1-7 clade bacterium]|uniref:Integrase catalytic domain-containing protein n=1 Tax=BD1-7 clade bacterium TaxID=2029982 RepID=A0A5S9Q2Q7_9GAMM|nr:Uncharacterised protein [BD1-7 clade bacterium]CAA0111897.1 Uncharacterised protein [BD1-7 clade bacterium]
MKEWFSAKELVAFDGLPGTVRAVQIKAKTENWQSRPRTGRGGGNEYHINSLPSAAQRAIRISQAKQAAAKARSTTTGQALHQQDSARQLHREESLARYQKLRPAQKKSIDAKLALLDAAAEFHQASGLSKTAAYIEFSTLYTRDEIRVEPWVREAVPTCSKPNLFRWQKKLNDSGIDALAGDTGKGRRGSGAIDTQSDLKEYILGMIVDKPHIKMVTLNKAIRAEFAGTTTQLVSVATLERWVNRWKEANRPLYTSLVNPDEWKNKYMDAQGSASEDVIALNQRWEFDSTPADLMLTDGRHSLLGAIDVWSRRLILIVMPTSDSKGVAKVIRKAILEWGVPETAKTDNGADYKSRWIKHVIKALDVEQEFCPPFQGWKKPHIERSFRTFSHDLVELLSGYIGHNVSERQAIEARKSFSDRLFKKDQVIDVELSSTDLQQFCNDWLEHEYHTRRHDSLGCSPNDKAASYTGHIRTVSNERLLDVLLSEPAGTRTITKKGIKLNGGEYVHPELAAHTSEQVHVFFDEADMGQIYVHDLNGTFLCTAEDPSITGVSRTEVAQKAKAIQKEAIEEERRRLKSAARKVTKRDVAQQILNHRASEEREKKVRHFPRPGREHTSAGLDAAQAALDALDAKSANTMQPVDPSTDKALAEINALIEADTDKAPSKATVIKPQFNRELAVPDGYEERYAFWLEVGNRIDAGTATDSEQKWHGVYKKSSHYQTAKTMYHMCHETAQKA